MAFGCQLAYSEAAHGVSDEPLKVTKLGCRPPFSGGHFTGVTLQEFAKSNLCWSQCSEGSSLKLLLDTDDPFDSGLFRVK